MYDMSLPQDKRSEINTDNVPNTRLVLLKENDFIVGTNTSNTFTRSRQYICGCGMFLKCRELKNAEFF
jgi:hypothetical protein